MGLGVVVTSDSDTIETYRWTDQVSHVRTVASPFRARIHFANCPEQLLYFGRSIILRSILLGTKWL
jgi:hypothetical protein